MEDLENDFYQALGATPPTQTSGPMVINVRGVGSKDNSSKYDDQFAQAGQKYGVDPAVLRGVARTESSFNPNAVSHDDNGKPLAHGLMQFTMPTAHALGVSDPYDPSQAIPAAAKLIRQNMDASNGDVTRALMMYHGGTNTSNWGPKTQAYPGKVLRDITQPSAAPADPSAFDVDSVLDAIKGNTTQTAQPGSTFQLPPASQPQQKTPQQAAAESPQVTPEQAQALVPYLHPIGAAENVLHMGSAFAGNILGGLAGAVTGNADNVQKVQNAVTYDPRTDSGKLGQQGLQNFGGQVKSKLLSLPGVQAGIDNYTKEQDRVGAISPALGALIATVPTAIQTLAMPEVRGALGSAVGAGKTALSLVGKTAPALDMAARVDPMIGPKPRVKLNIDGTTTPVQPPAAQGVTPEMMAQPKSTVTPNYASAESLAPDESPAAKGKALPLDQQAQRAAVLQRVGLTTARQSAIKGDAMTGATQSQMAKFNEPAGQAAKDTFDSERSALENHTQNIIKDVGGTIGTDERTLNTRGQVMAAPFDGLKKYLTDETTNLFNKADARSPGVPSVNLDSFSNMMNTDHNFSGKAGNQYLGNGVKSYLRSQKIIDSDGNFSPVTAQQAEGVKQYMNGQWTPENSRLIGEMKDSLSDDVFKSAGENIYKQGSNLHAYKKQTLDNPNGVSSLMDFDPRTPINRTTPFEKIPDAMMNLSTDQFQHVVDTLKNMPEHLQPQAQAALAEIKGHMVNSLLDTGSKLDTKWNAKGVTSTLDKNTAKNPMIFNQSELNKIDDLNKAGHILSVNPAYPGAAAQAANARKQGMMSHLVGGSIAAGGAGAGAFVLGPLGGTIGGFVGRVAGNSVSTAMGEAAAVKKFGKGIVKLSDFPK